MRRLLLPLALGGLVLLQACSCNEDKIIAPTEIITEEGDRGQWLSMATLENGTPVAAWYNRTVGGIEFGKGTITDDSITWEIEPVDGFADSTGLDSGDRGTFTSIAVAPGDVIWISYYDVTNKTLRYARRDTLYNPQDYDTPITSSWTTDRADVGAGAVPDTGHWTSMAIDPSGNPVVAYHDSGKGQLRVARWGGTSFSATTVDIGESYVPTDTATDEAPADVGEYANLLIGSDGTEYIAYYDRAFGRLRLAVGGASGYTITDVDDSADVGTWPSMLLADDNRLHIAYQDVTSQDLKHAWGGDGTFETEIVDSADYRGADSRIFRSGDSLAVVYFDGYSNDIMLARKTGDTWSSEKVAGDSAALGFHNAVVTSGGKHYAACYDYTNRGIWFQRLE